MSRTTTNTDPLEEVVPVVRPISIWQIERLAERFLAEWQPDMLRRPEPLDVVGLVDYLPNHDITISPGSLEELGECEAVTSFEHYPKIEIVVVEDQWAELFERTNQPLAHRARATVSHELGHAVLHAEELAAQDVYPKALELRMARRREIEPFRDPEWQAWAWAGFLLMPRQVLVELEELTPEDVGQVYDVSPEMARYYLRLLSRNGLL